MKSIKKQIEEYKKNHPISWTFGIDVVRKDGEIITVDENGKEIEE